MEIKQVATASEEQSSAAEQISKSIEGITSVSHRISSRNTADSQSSGRLEPTDRKSSKTNNCNLKWKK